MAKGNDSLLLPVILGGILILGFVKRCEWFKICGSKSTPPTTSSSDKPAKNLPPTATPDTTEHQLKLAGFKKKKHHSSTTPTNPANPSLRQIAGFANYTNRISI